jgi:regulator of replication initiation timing
MEEVVVEVMQVDKVAELLQTMAILSLNLGNLNLEVSSMKNRLATEEKEKAILQMELNKERDF